MKEISGRIKKLFEKAPLLSQTLIAMIKAFVIAVVLFSIVYLVLWKTGIYAKIETALNLKYNSLFILIPMGAFAALCVVCFMVGVLMYFHKYKRSKGRTDFYKAIAPTLWKK